jgi:NAD(P)-dependent dehydrogenase (short-subunit alcohol dehydrogenase family)
MVTGVTSRLGAATVTELARSGAAVLIAGRDERRLRIAAGQFREALPDADVRPVLLDLANLGSVRRAADSAAEYGALDILVNNAGVTATPNQRTVDGFELQFGTNHLGHFALTGLLLPLLSKSEAARVVTVSSAAHRWARTVPLTDPRLPAARYSRWSAYAESRLANLLFAFELDRRATAAGLPLASMGAHPGYVATKLRDPGPSMGGPNASRAIAVGAARLLAQSPAFGALPSLMAATMPGLAGGSFVGPGGFAQIRGAPKVVKCSRAARDEKLAARLWEVSAAATRVAYP